MDNDVRIAVLEKEVKELKAENKRLFQMLERMAEIKGDIDRLFLMVDKLAEMTTSGVTIDDTPAWQGTKPGLTTGNPEPEASQPDLGDNQQEANGSGKVFIDDGMAKNKLAYTHEEALQNFQEV